MKIIFHLDIHTGEEFRSGTDTSVVLLVGPLHWSPFCDALYLAVFLMSFLL